MKKVLCLLIAGVFVSLASAELYKPVRYFEFGIQTDFGASNNYFKMRDILTDTIRLDLNKIAREMPKGGLTLDAIVHEKTFVNINFHDEFRMSFFSAVEGGGYVNIAKDLFNLLGEGYQVGDSLDFAAKGYGDVFAEIGVSFYTKLWNTYGITITPSYVIPIMYIDQAKATLDFTTTEDGTIRAEAHAPVDVYTVVNLEKYDGGNIAVRDVTEDISSAIDKGGFDVTLAAERNVFERLDVGVFTRIPLIPGRLHYKMTENVYAYVTADNVLQNIFDGNDLVDYDYGVDDVAYTSTSTKYVWRPFKIGAEAAWRPFGNWSVIRPKLAIVARNPYNWSKITVWPEYALDAEFTIFNIVGLNFGTAYENRVFVQRIGCMFNVRILQIDVKAMLRGANFPNSFNWTGAGVFLGIKVGF